MDQPVVSRRGVYLDLEKSPYEYKTPYGDLFKFASAKKLEIYTRDIVKELKRLEDLIERNSLKEFIPDEIHDLLKRNVYVAFYAKSQR